MNWFGLIVLIILFIGYLVLLINDIIRIRNRIPYGKTFIKKFNDTLYDINRAQSIANCGAINAKVNDYNFSVKVNLINPSGKLNYSQMYKCYTVYIDEELVCREHIIHYNCKDKLYLEFSKTRKTEEIVPIVKAAHTTARKVIDDDWKRYLYNSPNSFYK